MPRGCTWCPGALTPFTSPNQPPAPTCTCSELDYTRGSPLLVQVRRKGGNAEHPLAVGRQGEPCCAGATAQHQSGAVRRSQDGRSCPATRPLPCPRGAGAPVPEPLQLKGQKKPLTAKLRPARLQNTHLLPQGSKPMPGADTQHPLALALQAVLAPGSEAALTQRSHPSTQKL